MNTAAIITAVATLVTATGGAIIAFTVLIPLLRRAKAIDVKTSHVADLVNSNHAAMLRREEVLIKALQRAGIDIPPNADIAL